MTAVAGGIFLVLIIFGILYLGIAMIGNGSPGAGLFALLAGIAAIAWLVF